MMKTIIAALLLLAGAAPVALATEAPGNESTDRVLPQASDAVVGTLISSVQTTEPGNHVLIVTVRTQRQLWGTVTNAVIEAKYREFTIPAIPEGISVSFANYTGSGIEWDAKTNSAYVCFLSQQTNGISLLRLEPAENATKVKAMFDELKNRKPQPESAGYRR